MIHMHDNFYRLSPDDAYMFKKLFSSEEIDAARWFLTAVYDSMMILRAAGDLAGPGVDPATLVRSNVDTANVFHYAVIPRKISVSATGDVE